MKEQHGHHVTPKKTLFAVFGALIVLTIVTALTAQIDLGGFNVPLALLIAGSKATLVAMFFMALKYDNPVNSLVFSLGIMFVGVFLIFTMLDTVFRGDLGNVGAETISDIDRRETMMLEREAEISPAGGVAAESADTSAADTTAAGAAGTTAADTTVADTTAADTTAEAEADNAAAPESSEP